MDVDGDGEGDVCDDDSDDDGVLNGSDNCPLHNNTGKDFIYKFQSRWIKGCELNN